jgi:DNA-binding response OmpR family regulator
MLDHSLSGLHVLIAEDELLIAVDLAEAFEREGAYVLGPASTLGRALSLINGRSTVDFGVLDLNLGGELVYPLADVLAERGIPFMFTTGYDDGEMVARFNAIARSEKPVVGEAVVEQVRQLLLRPALSA